MRKLLLIAAIIVAYSVSLQGQNIIIQQNNQQQTERVIVKEKKVPVYIKETNTPPKSPVCIFGYLYVYPEDLGRFNSYPTAVVNSINKAKAFGRNNWRLPTFEELELINANVSKLGKFARTDCLTYIYVHQYNEQACVFDTHCPIEHSPSFQIGGDIYHSFYIRLVSTD